MKGLKRLENAGRTELVKFREENQFHFLSESRVVQTFSSIIKAQRFKGMLKALIKNSFNLNQLSPKPFFIPARFF